MRTVFVLSLCILLTGCGLELLGATAIRSGLEAEQAQTLKKTLDYAQETTSLMSAQQGIAAYRAEKGINPPSLEAAVREGYLAEIPKQADGTPYGYDPQTGSLFEQPATPPASPPVASNQQPAAPQPSAASGGSFAEDLKTIQKIRGAIGNYHKDNKRLPPSLQSLTPKYLSEVPKTSTGQDFYYDPVTGIVYHPSQVPSQYVTPPPQATAPQPVVATPRRPVAVGGGGPLGEAMTGISMQQQLNSMSNAGANAAGSRARMGARGIGEQHTQQQERVMDNLGL